MTRIEPVLIIAEAGVNHNGSLELAHRLVDAAVDAGVNCVKFQSFRAGALVSRHAAKAAYQQATTGNAEGQLDMLRRLELPQAAQRELADYCRSREMEFLSTPFDIDSAAFLRDELGLSRLKISSGDLTNAPFLHALAQSGVGLILSTGMAMIGEIEQALSVLAHGYVADNAPSPAAFRAAYLSDQGQQALRDKVALLHCTTEYPTDPADVHLRAMDTLRDAFGLMTGYSDHSEGIAIPVAAAAREARIIEKHFTLDRAMEGPDHRASLDPESLKQMVDAVRTVERALGRSVKLSTSREEQNRVVARKSIVAARPISAGTVLTVDDIACKRPAEGLAPIEWWDLLGSKATRDFGEDEPIVP